MPKIADKYFNEIWKSIKGKINPRTKKPYTESDAWAMAYSTHKKQKGGK